MITGEIKNRIDTIWDAFWTGWKRRACETLYSGRLKTRDIFFQFDPYKVLADGVKVRATLLLALSSVYFSDTFSEEFDLMRRVHDSVEDCIGNSRITDSIVPARDRQLRCDDS